MGELRSLLKPRAYDHVTHKRDMFREAAGEEMQISIVPANGLVDYLHPRLAPR